MNIFNIHIALSFPKLDSISLPKCLKPHSYIVPFDSNTFLPSFGLLAYYNLEPTDSLSRTLPTNIASRVPRYYGAAHTRAQPTHKALLPSLLPALALVHQVLGNNDLKPGHLPPSQPFAFYHLPSPPLKLSTISQKPQP